MTLFWEQREQLHILSDFSLNNLHIKFFGIFNQFLSNWQLTCLVPLFDRKLQFHGAWKSQKKYYSTLRAKRATVTFWVDKSYLKMPKMVNLASFWKTEACGQTVLPDRSVLTGQKLVENAKIQKFKCDILSNFQTMWVFQKLVKSYDFRLSARFARLIERFQSTKAEIFPVSKWTISCHVKMCQRKMCRENCVI